MPLAAKGWPGTAIVWKNIIAITRGSLARSALIALMVIGAALATVLGTPHRSSTAVALGTTCVALVGFLSLLGPTWIRNDLRGDLMYLSLLRSYPLRGRTIVVAEVLGSVVSLTFLQLLLLAGAYGTLSGSAPWNRYLSLELSFVLAVPVIVVVNTIGLTIQNAGALLFPAWVRFEQYRPGGFDTLGQNILTMLFTMLLSALALVGPTLLGWTLWTLLQQTMGVWGILPAIAAGLALGVLELAGLIIWLGRVFERTESTA